MRRLLFVFLLIALPFQFTWAAAAGYCQHENAAGAGHFGHHGHQHQVKTKTGSDGASVDKKSGLPGDDPDCALCHLGCVQPLLSAWASAIDAPAGSSIASAPARIDRARPNRIERPRWSLAA